ncbi:YcgL domain-containing protein [Candidatus Endoriftia persephone]|jgi:uncharacterized protein YcgL (UPF0745 family)|uniref:YcgL domain-containing protein TevJSym_at00520 n=3 Tax=Gammaproteobacteria TaxID=1236 RepID=G2FH69_9GAMM|nr:YcgL domain-containing protein [Candidatus Endoriftia persephone]EGV50309.1 hypothetical protein Rifp1Sym_dl00090 [endosymbiont of Riftia pachyptila (vent Ph05)]EGW53883.1 hypothetical protein TevJSym_at00520 [endosymbiont of Tevnia jerichonana (vent Tica)]USF87731.1 YcgL domain-containing protein [Candidatus Endoriftia persephone]
MSAENIHCWIYRSPRKQEMYLYLREQDAFEQLPEPLLKRFGRPTLVMELELNAGRQLAREDVGKVMQNLHSQGFHLQMPPRIEVDLYQGDSGGF